MASASDVHIDEGEQKLWLDTEAGEAYIPWRMNGSKTIEYYYSFVPPALRGQGVGRVLCQAAMEYADKKGYEVVATCGYVNMTLARMRR